MNAASCGLHQMSSYKGAYQPTTTGWADPQDEEVTLSSFVAPLLLVLVIIFTAMGMIPMAMTTKDWANSDGSEGQCMLYASLTQYQAIGDTWGSDIGTCSFVAYGTILPILGAVLLLTLYYILRGRETPASSSWWRVFTAGALAFGLFHLIIVCMLTDGYTRTCLAILGNNANLDKYQYRKCSDGLGSRDSNYNHNYPTQQMLTVALVGYWVATFGWIGIVWAMVINMLHAKGLYCLL
ncbi:hypothetical protein FJT64_012793 [Amphibalanus amphitrite]|uniref:Uncharacterized protein n=1 Tax=Amphibalanus amphitrite TaxID=1232801 RepID=A0A6A4V5D8_AMPAM|nr:hypothetical protein FJT64_012793 [Amphibalanus amphitrite]